MIDSGSRIYVAGHRGLAGSAILRALQARGCVNLILRGHAELDLTRQADVERLFEVERPEYVFIAAAKVGGIHANNTYRADFIYQNLMIEANLIHAAYQYGVKKVMFLASNCIYPKQASQPMSEDLLLTGALEPTNEPYAVAKIAGIKLCDSYNRQHGTDFLCVIPAGLHGLNDNYDPQNSHVLPAMIRRMHEAKQLGHAEVVVWGSGSPRREFMSADDMAQGCLYLMDRFGARETGEFLNMGMGVDFSIRELAEAVARVVGYAGKIVFDTTKPDGVARKLLDSTRIKTLGWQPSIGLEEGLRIAYADFLQRYST